MEKIAIKFDNLNASESVADAKAFVELSELQLAAVGGGAGEATPA